MAANRLEPVLSALLAALAATVVVLAGPTGGDVPAHLYRTLLVHQNIYLWDNLWFAGQYPLVSYSLLYYPVAAAIGNLTLVVASVVGAAVLFQRICTREWGAAAIWPSRAFAILAAGPIFTGTYSYAAGFAMLLATIAALQSGRISLAIGCGALTLGFSPLAFIFLVIALAAIAVSRRQVNRRAVLFCAGLAVAAGVQLAALRLFPMGGRYPFRGIELATVLVVAGLGVIVALRAPRGGILAALFGFWLLASVALFIIPEPVGENVTRLRSVVFPLMLLTVLVARFRPRGIALVALALALVYNLMPYANAVANRTKDSRAASAAFWAPALQFLHDHRGGAFRVEVVPTSDHWEAWYIPRAGFPLARGWYRQLDIAENGALYRDPLSPAGYRHWLRRMAVRYVLLPSVTLGKKGADREARLLLRGAPGLRLAYRTPDWRIYEVRDPLPIMRGPGRVHVGAFTHDRIAARVTEPGTYRLAVRYMPYWDVKSGAVCVARAKDGMTELRVRRPGPLLLAAADGPSALFASALGDTDGDCR
ncbi:MAG TPA: hypothetical protein VFU10_06200 [Gaiellaceae bacterium]|nr:hypothetical protein [Gaiellaceae bacterium]